MNITFIHDFDTGFLSATLKPHLQALGHDVKILQTLITQLEGKHSFHIDMHLGSLKAESDYQIIENILKDTDYFILRCVTDTTLRALNVPKYANHTNAIFKVHGTDLRQAGQPYSLRTWKIDWSKHPLTVVGCRDYSLLPLYRAPTITHIERPCAFDTFPPKRTKKPPFVMHSPTNMQRKGSQALLERFKQGGSIEFLVLCGVTRQEVLKAKSQASYHIDFLDTWVHGPYGMNTVEAWYYQIPVWGKITHMDLAMIPELAQLIHPFHIETIAEEIHNYIPDRKQLRNAKQYALETHDSRKIAQQYVDLLQAIGENNE